MKSKYLAGLALLFSGVLAGCPQQEACANGEDDDKDGAIDCADDECTTDGSCLENCSDLIDNNRDGLIDCNDPLCATACDESTQCNDGQDNDQDGAEDCADADCATFVTCVPENCSNGTDDNGNGQTDCADIQCAQDPACPESNCINGQDDDNDGATDCADNDCAADPICSASGLCSNGADDDGDILVDAADPGCNGGVSEVDNNQCNNNIDDDFDGDTDAQDAQCAAVGHEATSNNALPNLVILGDNQRCDVFTDQNGNPTPGCQPLIRNRNTNVNDGEFKAGCFTGVGTRKIMEWNSIIVNQGGSDLVVGDPAAHGDVWTPNTAFTNEPLEFAGWTRSFLRDSANTVVAAGHKGSFCMIDLFDAGGGNGKFFDCQNNQGISVGLGDVYSIGLDCQFIDITGLPSGNYKLEVQVDFTHQLPESNYNDNSTIYDVVIP